jgi:hypothetical protein
MKKFFYNGRLLFFNEYKTVYFITETFLLFWERVKTLILRAPAKGKLAKMDNKR